MAYNNNIPSYHDLRALSIVWLRAIALAWEYLQPEHQDNPKAKRFLDLLKADTRQALTEYFNYQCPFSVNLEVFALIWENDSSDKGRKRPRRMGPGPVAGQWNAATSKTAKGKWSILPPNQIIFHLPTRPTPPTSSLPTSPTPMGDEAIALAAYADSGSNYLFSCC
jgi:ribosomally synthesized peptide (two-chain TOMM family)